MENQLDSYISNFFLLPQVMKHLAYGKSSFSENDYGNDLLKDSVNETAKGGMQTKRVIDYLNEIITNTPPQNFDKRVRDIVLKFKEIENKLFANWDSNGIYVINEETTKQNFELFLKKDIQATLYGLYVTNCLWLFGEFFIEFKKLCIEWSIDIGKIIDEIGFILIDSPNYISKLDTSDLTNPLTLDIKFLNDIHREFDDFLWHTVDIKTLKNWFRYSPEKIKIKEGITNSAFCYFMGRIAHKQNGISNTNEWMHFHIGGNNHNRLKREFINMAKDASSKRNNFSVTDPQRKALEMKDEIDSRLNRILNI